MSGSLRNRFSEQDIIFLLESGDGSLRDKLEIVKNDRAFIESLLEDRALAVLRRITAMGADEMLVTITPRFLFEVLLRAARKEMATRAYTIERTSLERVPVFDTGEVLGFIKDNAILAYLADMLMSFTRIQSYTRPVRVRKGLWRRIRYNDMDVDSLLRFCRTVDEEQRFDLYKRIGDVCLFTLGMFPEHIAPGSQRVPATSTPPWSSRRREWLPDDYEAEGRRFYRLAGKHHDSRGLGLEGILLRLSEGFHLARKPLNYISEHYLQFRRGNLFKRD
jgi:hypothetical protein